MNQTPSKPAATAPTTNPLFERAILISVSFSRLGLSKRVSGATINRDADSDTYSVNKRLLQCAEYDAIRKLDNDVKKFLTSKCLPSTVRGGFYFLPIMSVEDVDQKLVHYQARREQLVAGFVEIYPILLLQAEMRLRELYEPLDYPAQTNVANYFDMEWQTLTLGVPDVLETISSEMFERERAKAANLWETAQEQIQTLLRARLKTMLDHLTERLTPEPDGKTKVFRNSLVGNVESFLSDFNALNITDDHQLAAMVDQAKDLLHGVDAETLRTSTREREFVREGFEAMAENLDQMLIEKPQRAFSFEDI